MGIPNYFHNIIKNNNDIIKKLSKLKNIDNLYFDSNSIIYDCFNNIKDTYKSSLSEEFEKNIVSDVIKKINYYINIISPKQKIGIFFDGPAPLSKLNQQRTRRHRVMFENDLKEHLNYKNTENWNSTSITPGTEFMNILNTNIIEHYKNNSKIIISTSDEAGEGEHKIFQYIRQNNDYHTNTITTIYGLDADLIMLCLNHLTITKSIYLIREAPHFSKELNATPNELFYLDIPNFANCIINSMRYNSNSNSNNINNDIIKNYLNDYIFICFMLGNDFLPHFPTLSIRNNGIDILLHHYQNTIGRNNENITKNGAINWKIFKKFINSLVKDEENIFIEVHQNRQRQSKIRIPRTEDQYLTNLNYIPLKNRNIEEMINPTHHNWQYRYYKLLFEIEPDNIYKKNICINYLEGLEWVFKYYTNECKNWRWSYDYSYPPLFQDLIKYIPIINCDILKNEINKPISPLVQLSYVLPKKYHSLLPLKYQKNLREKGSHFYTNDLIFKWSYCKYFWESHIELPYINLYELENILI
jgi:5'-3' exonuclease